MLQEHFLEIFILLRMIECKLFEKPWTKNLFDIREHTKETGIRHYKNWWDVLLSVTKV